VTAAGNDRSARAYAAEVARLRAAHVPGESGRLRELFDFLAERGPDAPAASQADIADCVFGQADTAGDDATVRVYVHRLRKRLDDHYAAHGDESGRLTVPSGTYALRWVAADGDENALAGPPEPWRVPWKWLAAAVLLLALGFVVGLAVLAHRTSLIDAPPM
jgi:hypothetical protein